MIRRLSLTLWAAIFALVGAVCLLRPVNTDEFVWKFFQSRLWSDDMRNIAVIMMPSCEAYLVSPPAFMIPFRWLDNVLYGTPTPIWLRISGFATLAIWVALTIAMMGAALRRAGLAVSRSVTTLALLSVMMLGHMPILLTTNRPEQPALIGIAVPAPLPGRATWMGPRIQ